MAFNEYHKKYSNYHYCIVRECKNTSIKTNKLWIKVPTDVHRRTTWLKLANRDPTSLSTETQMYFCEDHFDLEKDMGNYMELKIMGSVKRIKIKPDCVPSRFLQGADATGNESPAPCPSPPCSVCRKTIKGVVFVCVQCGVLVCGECDGTSPHAAHYVLRVPPTTNEDGLKLVLIRDVCSLAGVSFTPKGCKDLQEDGDHNNGRKLESKPEIKLEVDVKVEKVEDGEDSYRNSSAAEASGLQIVPRTTVVKSEPPEVTPAALPDCVVFVCVQCGVRVCGECDGTGPHAAHYVLRVPPTRGEDDLKVMLLRIRDMISRAGLNLAAEGCKERAPHHDTDAEIELNTEIKLEIDIKEEEVEVPIDNLDCDDSCPSGSAAEAGASQTVPASALVKAEPAPPPRRRPSAGSTLDSEASQPPPKKRQVTRKQGERSARKPSHKVQEKSKKEYERIPAGTAYNETIADQSAEPMDLLQPLRSKVLTTAQHSTSSTPAPPTTTPRKTKAEKQREYRQRMAATRTPEEVIAKRKLDAERQRNCRQRKAPNPAPNSGSSDSNTASYSHSGARSNDFKTVEPGTSFDQKDQRTQSKWNTKWASAIMRFKLIFLDNDFGYACSVCDRLWFKNDVKPITAAQLEFISEWFVNENRQLCREEYKTVCNICKRTLNKRTMPPLAKVNGFSYPDRPPLPPLDPISERLVSPRLPFTQVRRLRHDASYGIVEQTINVPVDVQDMVTCLPRPLSEDDVINVNIERKYAYKSDYISGYTSESSISAWLAALQKSSLYRLYKINVDMSRLHATVPLHDDPSKHIENISAENTPEAEILASRQHTMLWNEEDCINLQAIPLNVIYDRHAEELSFPSIYFGEPRQFAKGVLVSPFMIATSEIRRRDRRGATPQKILYVAMKILRMRMVNGIHSTFRNVSGADNVTRRMLEDTEFLKEHIIKNLAFMKMVPNSAQYWASRKRDLFAMIRQLGKPTAFLTIGANEIRWMELLTALLKLSKKYPGKTAKDLSIAERYTLVSDDPVTCCIYFYKLVGSVMKMLKSKQSYNPFGKYLVQDYFLRIEFKPQGSLHAYILLWLNDDPRETVSENMSRTIDIVEKICSVARDDVPNDSIYANQIHKHTFSCTKRGETTCKFGVPYWPMSKTRVLLPISQSDGRLQTLQHKAAELGTTSLSERRYTSMTEFLDVNGLTYDSYLDVVRSTLRRPTLIFKRNFDELMTNTFNPYLAGELNSNIEINFILDDDSCAEYVAEYVNKSTRGMSDLRREITTMMQEHPERDYTGQLKALSMKMLNAVEMSAPEAAWYLLRQPMSETSRPVVYIPTVWPLERQRCRKRRIQMDREGLDGDSTDIWTKNIIQRYEERPASLEGVYLAEFASWYASANDFVDEDDDVHGDDDEDSEAVPEARTSRAPKEYRRRRLGRVIRYRRYDLDETDDCKREMVLLYVQFRNEMTEIIERNKFLKLFEDNKDTIMKRRSLFETNLNIENVTKGLEATMTLQNDDRNFQGESRAVLDQRLLEEDGTPPKGLDCEKTQRTCMNNQPRTTGDYF